MYRNEAPKRSNGNSKKSKKKKSMRLRIITVILVAVLCVGIGGFMFMRALTGDVAPPDVDGQGLGLVDPSSPPFDVSGGPDSSPGLSASGNRKPGVYTVLVAGADHLGGNTDTMLLATLDTVQGKLNVMSIPRDTQVNVSRKIKKINAAWAIGKADQLKKELQSFIGFAPDSYMVVDLKGFVRLVDAMDGVDFDVPRRMHYSDPGQNLYINLEKGFQHLNGDKAIQLLRFRHTYVEGDIQRVRVQQDFLKAMASQMLKGANVFKIPEFVDIVSESVKTDLTTGNMIWFMQELFKLKEEDIEFHIMPGDTSPYYKGQSYVIIYEDKLLEMVNEYFNPYLTPITSDNVDISKLRDK